MPRKLTPQERAKRIYDKGLDDIEPRLKALRQSLLELGYCLVIETEPNGMLAISLTLLTKDHLQ